MTASEPHTTPATLPQTPNNPYLHEDPSFTQASDVSQEPENPPVVLYIEYPKTNRHYHSKAGGAQVKTWVPNSLIDVLNTDAKGQSAANTICQVAKYVESRWHKLDTQTWKMGVDTPFAGQGFYEEWHTDVDNSVKALLQKHHKNHPEALTIELSEKSQSKKDLPTYTRVPIRHFQHNASRFRNISSNAEASTTNLSVSASHSQPPSHPGE